MGSQFKNASFLSEAFFIALSLRHMGRLIAIDYGTKRTGIAVTDELQIIASGLTTVETKDLVTFLKEYPTGSASVLTIRNHIEKLLLKCFSSFGRLLKGPTCSNNCSYLRTVTKTSTSPLN